MGERPRRRDPQTERSRHKVPSWYVPLHLGVTIGLLGGVSIALLALLPLGTFHWTVWLAAVAVILTADFVEYSLHRWPMHRRKKATDALFKRHTLEHHRLFTYEAMGIEKFDEVFLTTFNVSDVVVALASMGIVGGIMLPIFGLKGAMVIAAALGLYGTFKQAIHMAFHLPESWMRFPVLRSRAFYWLREHHALHHDPRMMTRWNFNIGLPTFDALFGTLRWTRE